MRFKRGWGKYSALAGGDRIVPILVTVSLEFIDLGGLAGRSRIGANFYYSFNWDLTISELWPAEAGSHQFLLQL